MSRACRAASAQLSAQTRLCCRPAAAVGQRAASSVLHARQQNSRVSAWVSVGLRGAGRPFRAGQSSRSKGFSESSSRAHVHESQHHVQDDPQMSEEFHRRLFISIDVCVCEFAFVCMFLFLREFLFVCGCMFVFLCVCVSFSVSFLHVFLCLPLSVCVCVCVRQSFSCF